MWDLLKKQHWADGASDISVNWPEALSPLVHFTFTFTFMHLADAFIQSNLHCIQVTVFYVIVNEHKMNIIQFKAILWDCV